MSEDLKERVEKMLAGLGDTADAVADSLRAKGIKGNLNDGECCPVANLLSSELDEAAEGKWGAEADWWVELGHVRTPAGLVSNPVPVKEFIAVFDDGETVYDDEDPHVERPYADLEYEYVVGEDSAEAARAET